MVVTSFVSNTYHAMVHYEGGEGGCISAQVDSRPSDAINLALRSGTPVYVSNKVCSSVSAEAVIAPYVCQITHCFIASYAVFLRWTFYHVIVILTCLVEMVF